MCRSLTILIPHTHQLMWSISHKWFALRILRAGHWWFFLLHTHQLLWSCPISDLNHSCCVQVIDDYHFPIPIGPFDPCPIMWFSSCIPCASHWWFFLLIPTSSCDPCPIKWFALCILCAGHRRFSFPHTHQPLRSMSSRVLKSGGIGGGLSSSVEKAMLKKKRKKKKKKKKKKKVRSYPSRNAFQSPTIPEETEEDEDDVSFLRHYLVQLPCHTEGSKLCCL